MSEAFTSLISKVKELQEVHFCGQSSFTILKTLDDLKTYQETDPVKKEQAQKNIDIINEYRYFFCFTHKAHFNNTYLQLGQFFDNHKDSCSIKRFINFAEDDIKDLGPEKFKSYAQKEGRSSIDFSSYEGIAQNDLDKCKSILREHGLDLSLKNPLQSNSLIGRAVKVRNEIAHTKFKNQNPAKRLTIKELEKLFAVTDEILNIFSSKLIRNMSWNTFSSQEHHTKLVVEYLGRFEPYRLKEIKDEYKETLRKYTRKS